MKKTFRFIALLLAFALLLGLCACQGSPAPTQSTQPPTSQTEAPEPTAAELYEEAVASLADGEYEITLRTTRTTGDASYTYELEQTLIYQGMGTEGFTALVEGESVFSDDYSYDSREVYQEGMTFLRFFDSEGSLFSSPADEESFLSRQIPLKLLDSTLYESVIQEADGTFRFSQASALERWVAPEYAELLEASGSAELWKDGSIKALHYKASYLQGPVTVEQSCTLSPVGTGTEEDISQYVPEEKAAAAAVEVEDPSLLYRINDAAYLSLIIQNCSLQSTSRIEAASEAAGVALVQNDSMAMCGVRDDLRVHLEYNIMTQGYQEDSSEDIEIDYYDGMATMILNGGEPTTEAAVPATYSSAALMSLSAYIPLVEMMQTVSVQDRNGYWYVEYTGTEETGLALEDQASYALAKDEDFLDNYASEYKTDKMEGYVFIDKDSGFPVACGMDFQGRHNIEGTYCRVYFKMEQTIAIGDLSIYTDITDEMFPEELEDVESPSPVFYQVTSPEGGKMYLFGTIHLGDERTGKLPQEIYDAFNEADALAVECDIQQFEEDIETDEALLETAANSYYYLDGTTTADHLSQELAQEAEVLLRFVGGGVNGPYFRPSCLANLFTNKLCYSGNRLTSEQGVDNRLLRLAKEQGKEILEVESVELQLNLDVRYSESLQGYLLQDAAETDRNEYLQSVSKLYELWCEGSEEKLMAHLRDNDIPEDATEEIIAANEEYNRLMLAERDANMLEVCKGYLDSGEVVFVAVGLAHLLGETGLVDALRAAGYTVELVEYG